MGYSEERIALAKERVLAKRREDFEVFDKLPAGMKRLVHEYGEDGIYGYVACGYDEKKGREWCESERKKKQEKRCNG